MNRGSIFEILLKGEVDHLRSSSKREWLEDNMGGKWTYEGRGGFFRSWHCDDGRKIRYTAAPVDECDNVCGRPQCWLDTPGEHTQPFVWSKEFAARKKLENHARLYHRKGMELA